MSPRLASGVLVSALIRRVEAAGGHAMVLAKGDAMAGAILIVAQERGRPVAVRERMTGLDGRPALVDAGPKDLAEPGAITDYLTRRRRGDPDLWAVELDVADALDIAVEVLT